jgi:hypothetical protein
MSKTSKKSFEDLTEKYAGRRFVFFSPFTNHPGFEDGQTGTLIRHDVPEDPIEDDASDLWLARNEAGEEQTIVGGEAYDPDSKQPVIVEHRFTNWKPHGY